MGDGGVACVPSQHVVERFPEAFCAGGGSNGNGFSSKAVQLADSTSSSSQHQQQRKNENNMEVEREGFSLGKGQNGQFKKGEFGEEEKLWKGESEREESGLEKQRKGEVRKEDLVSGKRPRGKGEKLRKGAVEKGEIVLENSRKGDIEKGEIVPERWCKGVEGEREEFSSEKVCKSEFKKGDSSFEKLRKGDIEKGEITSRKWRKEEVEKGERILDEWQKEEIEKGEIVPEKWQKEELEKGEFVPDKWRKGEVEKGEIVSERRRKGESTKEEFGSGRSRRWEVEKGEFVPEKGRNRDRETPPSVKFMDEDVPQRNGSSRSGSERRKRSSRWEAAHERDSKNCSRIMDDESGLYKSEYGDEKSRIKDYMSGAWLKRHGPESESSSRRYSVDDYLGSKSRRISDDNNHSGYSDKLHLRSSVESSYRNVSLSSRVSSTSRYTSRHNDTSSSSRGHDRHGRSPGHSERSPHNRARYHDHRDRSPTHLSDRHGRSPGHSERSPHNRARHYDHKDRSPGHLNDRHGRSPAFSERSPHNLVRNYDHRDRSPGHLGYSERSPHVRCRHHDHKDRSPVRSPRDRPRHRDHRDRTPLYLERSPYDPGRINDNRDTNRKTGGNEKHNSRYGSQGQEEKPGRKDSGGRDSHRHVTSRQSNNNTCLANDSSCPDKNVKDPSYKEKETQNEIATCSEVPSQVSETPEELPSMEEDMDICDTPPHAPIVADSTLGNWFYLDHFGMEQGPSKLHDLKRLVEEGFLQSDHLIKHSESDRWVTVENAASPLVPNNFPSIFSDTETQMVNPPEAPGNLLVDAGDVGQSANQPSLESSNSSLQPLVHRDEGPVVTESLEDLHIDERVGALLKGYTVIPGRELESLGEALQTMFEHAEWEKWGNLEGFSRSRPRSGESSGHPRDEESGRGIEGMHKETVETRFLAPPEKDYSFLNGDSSDWSSSLWSCKGGDWKRNDDTIQERSTKRKLVLNEGYPLCQMPKSGYEDPRWHRKDDLYHPSRNRRLDLPHWAFTISDEKNDINGDQSKSILAGRSNQLKAPLPRGVRGTLLPVVRINACVVKDHGPFASDTRSKVRSNERHGSRPIRSYSASGDSKSSISDGVARSKAYERDLQLQALLTGVNAPKDRVCTVDELHLNLGDWYYLDGAGHERGPSLLSELQALVSQGIIQKNTSVFRKFDKIWVPITPAAIVSESVLNQEGQEVPTADSSVVPLAQQQADHSLVDVSSSFHNLHPQFIGYMRGKLHELVMKSYRSREFAAAINEVLDPWMNANQPKKETDKHFPFNSAITKSSSGLAYDLMNKVQKSEDDYTRAGKRARLLADGSEDDDDDDEMEEDLLIGHNDTSFEDLCSETSHGQENISTSKTETESWGLLNGRILARVFHHLRMDLKSLATSAATCKCWNAAVKFYRDISRQVDLSSIGPNCTDSMFWNIMSYYDKTKITSVVLVGCTNVSAGALQEVLQSFSSITSVDIRGCSQFRELRNAFKNVKWIRSHGSHSSKISEESNSKMRSLKQITDKSYLNSKAFKGSSSNLNDSSKMMDSFDYYSSLDWKDLSNHAFGRSCYKRTKLLNARKSSSILSRDARMRRWLHRKSENGYKMMEEFLVLSLKDIMRENTCQFFITKVPEIEDKMKNGYYIRRGLSSFKDDISRMCRDAIKAKSRGGSGDMKRIILLFLQLLTSLEENSNKSCNERDEMIKMLKDSSLEGSTTSKYKKKHNKILNEGRGMPRNNGTSYVNGGHDYGDYDASDREIRRRLSKLNKRTMESESETSDDHDLFEEDRGDAENSDSETETDPDIHSEAGTGDSRGLPFVDDEALDSEEHEWGARMTEASLVPPVTRKYEVIDRYVIVADEDEVQRKMRVALPDDYIEKLSAQKNGTEESDMEIPEVKDYKPRKKVGDEVLEQEVYGIDPYTHNLLLDSMPKEDPEWPLLEKHSFIEEVLLRALNQRVRHFTGTGNAPMIYPLRPVVEEILKGAEEGGDTRIMKMCQEILKAMQNRSSTKYVAYRKGLGVVCNKEEGFGEDDFVVEFLGEVYPSWKWFEKQDGIRSLQKDSKDPAPEFYNIYLERPKGDRDGYDLVVVDAMHKANYASRICHSCRPNCEAKVTAVDGQYQIGIYTVRAIRYGEEITFDYNSVTESKEEYEKSVCLCGSQVCRGSYLNLTGEGAFQKVLKECHGILDRHRLMLESCDMNSVSEEDYVDLRRAGLGTCLLSGLPDWLIAYSAHLVRFINFERTKLPDEILKHNLGEKRKLYSDSEICLELEKSDAEIQAEGVYNQRLQNLALTLDKVRYAMRCVFGDPKIAPPPLEKISPEDLVSLIWKGEGSLVEELVLCIAPHTEADLLDELKSKIRAHDPSGSDDIQRQLQKSLLWLRDELRDLPCTHKCRHDAAADLIHMYAYTKCFFRVRDYKSFTSPPVYISPDDLCPKYADKLGSGFQEYCKKYGENYCLGQLIYWHNQANAEPDCSLSKARRGCVSLPDVSSFYAKSQKLSYKRVYGPRTVKFMLSRMEKDPQRPWPKDKIWTFKSAPQILGSPMLDAVMNKSALDKEMVHWLKCRRPCSMPRDG